MAYDKEQLSRDARSRFDEFHHPVVDGVIIPPTRYLYLPLREETAKFNGQSYRVSQGWQANQEERDLHGEDAHKAFDLQTDLDVPLYAPCSGYATATYWSYYPVMGNLGESLPEKNGVPIETAEKKAMRYKGKPITYGFGYHVTIFNPQTRRHVLIAHMMDIDEKIPFSKPEFNDGNWIPINSNLLPHEYENNPMAVFLEAGERIGSVGASGLRAGYAEHIFEADRPVRLNTRDKQPWDIWHAHVEEFSRGEYRVKRGRRDPYGLYSNTADYPSHGNPKPMGPETLFFVDKSELPQYAP